MMGDAFHHHLAELVEEGACRRPGGRGGARILRLKFCWACSKQPYVDETSPEQAIL